MPTGYEIDTYRAIVRMANALERQTDLAELQYLEKYQRRTDEARIVRLEERLWPKQ